MLLTAHWKNKLLQTLIRKTCHVDLWCEKTYRYAREYSEVRKPVAADASSLHLN